MQEIKGMKQRPVTVASHKRDQIALIDFLIYFFGIEK